MPEKKRPIPHGRDLAVRFDDEDKKLFVHNKCEKADYIAALAAGAVGAVVDLFVGLPGQSKLSQWTDKMADEAVKKFAALSGWRPKSKNADNIASAIGYLERRYKVGYDARYASDLGLDMNMSASNHHLKSLAHAPDLIGLFCSLLCQFTGKAVFASNGKITVVRTNSGCELVGGTVLQKLFCGTVNWIGHIMSDIAGSSGRRGHNNANRGSGIGMPFYELFQLFDFGSFKDGDASYTIAELSTKVFENGYDARFFAAQAIPVIVCNLLTKLLWALMRRFKYHRPLSDCIPSAIHDDLRIMLLVSNGTLCAVNTIKAAVLSGGNWVTFFTRINYPAWCTLLKYALREVLFRMNIYTIDAMPEIYRRINEEIVRYHDALKAIDLERFYKESALYADLCASIDHAQTEEELQLCIESAYVKLGIAVPWEGDFDAFMADKNNHLVFS